MSKKVVDNLLQSVGRVARNPFIIIKCSKMVSVRSRGSCAYVKVAGCRPAAALLSRLCQWFFVQDTLSQLDLGSKVVAFRLASTCPDPSLPYFTHLRCRYRCSLAPVSASWSKTRCHNWTWWAKLCLVSVKKTLFPGRCSLLADCVASFTIVWKLLDEPKFYVVQNG